MYVTSRIHVIGSVVTDADDATLAAAKAGDRDAGASVLADMESRLAGLARRTAKLTDGDASDGLRDAYTEDLTQEAALITWERLTTYQGETLDGFRAYAYSYVEKELPARARDMMNGTDDDTDGKKLFAQMVKHFRAADPNNRLTTSDYVDMAERAVQDKAMVSVLNGGAYKSRVRMSPEAAYAARLAYQGVVSIFQPTGTTEDGGDITILDTLEAALGTGSVEALADVATTGVRPFQWTAAVRTLEDGLAVPRGEHTRDALFLALDRFRTGLVTEEDLDLVESLPCRSKAVGDAVAMLRSLLVQSQDDPEPSQAERQAAAALGRGSIALTAQRDIRERALDRIVRRTLVRRVMGMMAPRQAYILAATFGFMGRFKDDAQMARSMASAGVADIDAARVRKDREKARAAFAKKWADLVAKTGSEAAALELAADKAAANTAKAEAQGVTFLSEIQED